MLVFRTYLTYAIWKNIFKLRSKKQCGNLIISWKLIIQCTMYIHEVKKSVHKENQGSLIEQNGEMKENFRYLNNFQVSNVDVWRKKISRLGRYWWKFHLKKGVWKHSITKKITKNFSRHPKIFTVLKVLQSDIMTSD